ncbi:MAG TPA: hypothetical protein VK204_15310 [Nocardioidaceae bacterium]|nr:hypothetical protein [Nocardioidaceae bacterium]
MRSFTRHLAVTATALGTLCAGLVSAAPAGAVAAGQTVNVLVRRDHSVVMPGSIRPGLTNFRITSRRAATFQILEPAPGYAPREAIRDANAAFTKNNIKALRRFEANTTLLGGLSTRRNKPGTLSVKLPTGRYWALDVSPRVLKAANAVGLQVTGTSVGGRNSGRVIRAVDDTKWGKLTPSIPTRGRIWFQNRSTENHFLVAAMLAKGKTMKDFRAWIRQAKQGKQTPPPLVMTGGLDTGVISPGKSMSFDYRLPRGNYVLMCFWPDADMGGTPHVLMGMYRGLRVG